jgi:glycosyltransferase involved in cell wall biosynthesis
MPLRCARHVADDLIWGPYLMSKKVFLLDYELWNKVVHCYNYDNSVRAACAAQGVPVKFYVCKAVDEAFRREVDAEPLFTTKWLEWDDNKDVAGYLQRVTEFNVEFLNDLMPLTPQVDADSVIFMPAIRIERLMGLQMWLASFPKERMPNAVIVLRFDISDNALFRHALEQFKSLGPKIRFAVDTEELRQAYARVGCPTDIIPIPHSADEGGENAPDSLHPAVKEFLEGPGGPVVAWFGGARLLKGFHLLPEIIAHLTEVGHDLRFLVQAPGDSSLFPLGKEHIEPAFGRLRALAEKNERILWIDMAVEDTEYRYLMHHCDIVLLPYTGQRYRTDSSGIFSEAVAAGKISIVPEGSSMANEAKRCGAAAIAFSPTEPAAVALAVVKALARYDALRQDAADVAAGWAAKHAPHLLADYLLA